MFVGILHIYSQHLHRLIAIVTTRYHLDYTVSCHGRYLATLDSFVARLLVKQAAAHLYPSGRMGFNGGDLI